MIRNLFLTLLTFFIGSIAFSQVRNEDPLKKVVDTLIVPDTLVKLTISKGEFILGKEIIDGSDTVQPTRPDFESKMIVWIEMRTPSSSSYSVAQKGIVTSSGSVMYYWRYPDTYSLNKLKDLDVPMTNYQVTKDLWDQITHKRNQAKKFRGLAFGGMAFGAVSGILLISQIGREALFKTTLFTSGLMCLVGFTGYRKLNKNYVKDVKSAIDVYNSCVRGNYQSSINYKLQIGFSDFSTPSIGLNISF